MITEARPMPLKTANDMIVRELSAFLVATPFHRAHMNPAPFDIPLAHVIDPLRMESAAFLHLLSTLDRLTFGPTGMPMPKWVFFDGAELPGGIFGFGRPARDVLPSTRERFGVPPDYDGLVPFSMFIAIPMLEPGTWMGHNLASIHRTLPGQELAGLGSITKALGLKTFGARVLYGATQWSSPALHIHTKFGPLDLVTAYTPAHSKPETLTYRVAITDECLRAACGDPAFALARPAATRVIDAEDHGTMRELQRELLDGARYQIVSAPRREAERVFVPLARVG
jgi:hypothetical protein